jgi:hypothetical protein
MCRAARTLFNVRESSLEDRLHPACRGTIMSSTTAIALVIFIIAVCFVGWFLFTKRRTQKLRTRFGPEYDHALKEHGSRAEAILERREKRVEKYHIVRLTREDRERFAEAWRNEQSRFVDDPTGAVLEGDRLVAVVMQQRGYPTGEFEQMAADVSVDHPHEVDNYRVAHAIALRAQRGETSTEDLRKAMVHFRALFEDLLETNVRRPEEVRL